MIDVCPIKATVPGYALVPMLGLLFLLGSCSQPEIKPPVPITPPEDRSTAAVVRVPAPEPISPYQPELLIRPLSVVVPVGAIYLCVNESAGQSRQTVIEFSSPKVKELCRKHPEMGPCQYERDLCRNSGGRVYAAGGTEITLATEAEYDKRVMRVRFRAN
jgi:hypothetical protein